jgi:tetratricopeptide (TPR) repeat protein
MPSTALSFPFWRSTPRWIPELPRAIGVMVSASNPLPDLPAKSRSLNSNWSSPETFSGTAGCYVKHWLRLLLALVTISSAQAQQVARGRGCTSDDPRIALTACTDLLARPDLPANVKAAAFFQRALAYLAFQRRQEAVNDLTAAIENDPGLALAYLNRATILHALGLTSQAIEDATKAIALAPNLPAAFANRSWFYQGIGKFDEAVNDATRAIGLSPDFAQAYTNRGAANVKRKHFDAAIADYTVSTSLDENNAGAIRQLGLLTFYAGDFAGAAESLAKALALKDDP